jgi:DNA-binding CsgD family transcriptional regulator
MASDTFGAQFPHEVLDLFEGLIGVSASCFYLVSEDQRAFGHVLNGMEYETLPDYNRTYEKLDPFHPRRFMRSEERIITLQGALHQASLEKSTYYREFLHPQGMYYETEIFFRSPRRILAGVSLHRSKSDGAFRPEEISVLQPASRFVEQMVREYYPTLASSSGSDAEEPCLFTSREKDIIALVRTGHTNADIGRKLGIQLATVKTHMQNIFRKAEVTSRTALIARSNLY